MIFFPTGNFFGKLLHTYLFLFPGPPLNHDSAILNAIPRPPGSAPLRPNLGAGPMPGDPRVQPLGPPQALNLNQPAQTLTLVQAPQNIQTTRVQQTASLKDVTDEIIQMPSGLGGDSPAQNAIPRPPGSAPLRPNLVAGPMPGDPRVQPLGPSQALNLIQPAISGFTPPPLPPSAPPSNGKFFSGNT